MLFWAIFKWDRDVRLCNQSICCPLTIIQLFIESHNGMIIIIYYCLFLSLAICFAYCNEFIFFIMKTTEWRITPSDQTWNIDCEAKNNWKKTVLFSACEDGFCFAEYLGRFAYFDWIHDCLFLLFIFFSTMMHAILCFGFLFDLVYYYFFTDHLRIFFHH